MKRSMNTSKTKIVFIDTAIPSQKHQIPNIFGTSSQNMGLLLWLNHPHNNFQKTAHQKNI